jgi:L-amino acid N-acyltransferase YncA
MARLIDAARRKGVRRLHGAVLRENAPMLSFVAAFGFSVVDNPVDTEQVTTVLDLANA